MHTWPQTVATINTLETFWSAFNRVVLPSQARPMPHASTPTAAQMELGANYHFFKLGIEPMWEDKANRNGGKWVLQLKPSALGPASIARHTLQVSPARTSRGCAASWALSAS